MLHISNSSLVEECRKGDKEALNLFYLRFAPRMLSVIRRYICDERDAEDVLHDGFIVALTRLDSLRDADKVELWLATIMKNLSLQFLQSQDMVKILHEIPEVEDAPEFDEIMDMASIELLIDKLPPGYQKVFRLAILENQSHKEIGKLLGIAPNSSSSQLFHAKLMMRKLITEYKIQTGLGCVFLLSLLIGLLFLHREPNDFNGVETFVAKSVNQVEAPVIDKMANVLDKPIICAKAQTHVQNRICREDEKSVTKEDQIREQVTCKKVDEANVCEPGTEVRIGEVAAYEPVVEAEDSVESREIVPPVKEENLYYAFAQEDNIIDNYSAARRQGGGWSVKVGADAGLLSFNTLIGDNYDMVHDGCLGADNRDPEESNDKEKERKIVEKNRAYNDYRRVSHSNSLPITVAVSAAKRLNNVFSIETGVRYTYLHSSFETKTSKAHCHWHYAGIPLKLNVKMFSARRFRAYVGAGGAVDIPLYSYADVTSDDGNIDLSPGRFSSSVVWSLSGNLGMSIELSKRLEIFIEPTLQYHFNHDFNVPNIWSDNNWGFSLPIGFRFNM